MFFDGQAVLDFLSNWGYWIIIPLMIIEGPIVTILAAMLASAGTFNIGAVLVLSIGGDVIGDVFLYGAGRKWGMQFVDNVGKYLGINRKLVLRMEHYYRRHGGKTVFAVKSTTGLCWATFVAAGIAKMDFGKFVKYSVFGGIVWSGCLVLAGYFYGYMWLEIGKYIEWIGWVIMGLVGGTFVIITLYKKYNSKKLLDSHQ